MMDFEEEFCEIVLWMVLMGEGELLCMMVFGYLVGSLCFSLDGCKLVFLLLWSMGKGESKMQVWVFDLCGGDVQLLIMFECSVGSYVWLLQGDCLLFSLSDEELEVEGEDEDKFKFYVIDCLQFKCDYVGYFDCFCSYYYVYDLSIQEFCQIILGDYDDFGVEWSFDGKFVVFVSNCIEEFDGNDNIDFWIVLVDNNDEGCMVKCLMMNLGSDLQLFWSLDGCLVIFVVCICFDIIWYDVGFFLIVDIDLGEVCYFMEDFDCNVLLLCFFVDGQYVYFLFEDLVIWQFVCMLVKGGCFDCVFFGECSVCSFYWNEQGDIVFFLSMVQSFFEVYWMLVNFVDEYCFFGVNVVFFEGFCFGEVKNVYFKSVDGMEIEGFIMLLLDYDE